MTLLDGLWITILVLSAAISIARGFVREVFSLAAWILALIVAARVGGRLARALGDTIEDPQVRAVTAFLLLFFVTLLLASLAGKAAYKLVHKSGLQGTDRSLGFVFGCIRGIVVAAIVVIVLRGTEFGSHPSYTEATLRPVVDPAADFLHRLLPSDFGRYFDGAFSLGDRPARPDQEPLDREGLEQVIREGLDSGN